MTSKVVRKMDLDVWQQNIVPRSWCRNLDMSSAKTNCAKDYISHVQKFWRTGKTDLVDCLRQMWNGIPCSPKSWRICHDEFEWVHMKTRRICLQQDQACSKYHDCICCWDGSCCCNFTCTIVPFPHDPPATSYNKVRLHLHSFAIAILEKERGREYIATSSTVIIPKQIQHWGAGRTSLLSTFGMCEFVQSCWSHHDRHSNSETQNSCRCVDAAHVHKYSRSKPAHNTTQLLVYEITNVGATLVNTIFFHQLDVLPQYWRSRLGSLQSSRLLIKSLDLCKDWSSWLFNSTSDFQAG